MNGQVVSPQEKRAYKPTQHVHAFLGDPKQQQAAEMKPVSLSCGTSRSAGPTPQETAYIYQRPTQPPVSRLRLLEWSTSWRGSSKPCSTAALLQLPHSATATCNPFTVTQFRCGFTPCNSQTGYGVELPVPTVTYVLLLFQAQFPAGSALLSLKHACIHLSM
jgi:hypothetical protein